MIVVSALRIVLWGFNWSLVYGQKYKLKPLSFQTKGTQEKTCNPYFLTENNCYSTYWHLFLSFFLLNNIHWLMNKKTPHVKNRTKQQKWCIWINTEFLKHLYFFSKLKILNEEDFDWLPTVCARLFHTCLFLWNRRGVCLSVSKWYLIIGEGVPLDFFIIKKWNTCKAGSTVPRLMCRVFLA